MSDTEWIQLAYTYGLPPIMLAFFVYGLHKGWIVMGRTHEKILQLMDDALRKETVRANKWETRAEGLLERAASSVQTSERVVAKIAGEDTAVIQRRRQAPK